MDKKYSLISLSLLCFALADVRDGLGPFIGIYLQQHNFTPDKIGFVMTLSGLAGIIFSSILGAVTDKTKYKRLLLAFLTASIAVSSFILLIKPDFINASITSIIQGIASAGIAPLLTGITIGLSDKDKMAARFSKNEAWNHFGNALTASLSGLLGYYYGIIPVFIIMSVMALLSIIFTMAVKKEHIDYDRARGAHNNEESIPLKDLLKCMPLLAFGLVLFFFHFSNAAILPLLGQSAGDEFKNINTTFYTAITVLIAQSSMIIMAVIALKVINKKGAVTAITLTALAALPVRALIAGYFHSPEIMVIIQILDGVGAGFMGVVVPVITANILANTGRINTGMGILMTMQAAGAALSTTYAGILAARFNYSAAFIGLAFMAFAALFVFIFSYKFVKGFAVK